MSPGFKKACLRFNEAHAEWCRTLHPSVPRAKREEAWATFRGERRRFKSALDEERDAHYFEDRRCQEEYDREVLAYEDGRIETAASLKRDELKQDMEADRRAEAAEHQEDDDG